jgi:hypothetical protein
VWVSLKSKQALISPQAKKKKGEAVERSGVALAVTVPAESTLEFAREEHTAGPFVHTPACCYDPDDPNFGFDELDDQTCLGGGDWGDFVDDSGG